MSFINSLSSALGAVGSLGGSGGSAPVPGSNFSIGGLNVSTPFTSQDDLHPTAAGSQELIGLGLIALAGVAAIVVLRKRK